MQFAAVFVEYLVTGVVAIVWILPLLGVGLKELDNLEPGHVTLLVPLVYVTGMFLDVVASVILRPVREHARCRKLPWLPKVERNPRGGHSRTTYIILHSPELGSALQLRTSRDRIARGAWLNLAFTAVIASLYPTHVNDLLPGDPVKQPLLSGGLILLTLVAFLGWWQGEYQTQDFKQDAIFMIDNKLATEKARA